MKLHHLNLALAFGLVGAVLFLRSRPAASGAVVLAAGRFGDVSSPFALDYFNARRIAGPHDIVSGGGAVVDGTHLPMFNALP